jgi:hypothetical protein
VVVFPTDGRCPLTTSSTSNHTPPATSRNNDGVDVEPAGMVRLIANVFLATLVFGLEPGADGT